MLKLFTTAAAMSEQSTVGSSGNTSEYTVHQTGHLKEHAQERTATTREAAVKQCAKSPGSRDGRGWVGVASLRTAM